MAQTFYHATMTATVTPADYGDALDNPAQVIHGYGRGGWLRPGTPVYVTKRPAWTHAASGRTYPAMYLVYHTQGYVVMPEAAAKKFLRCVRVNGAPQADTTGQGQAIAARMGYHVSQ